MRTRTLSLKSETLTELVPAELTVVVGASAGPTCYTCLTICGICVPPKLVHTQPCW